MTSRDGFTRGNEKKTCNARINPYSSRMSDTNQLAALNSALTLAFAQGSTLMGSYLDNLGVYDYSVLTVLWQDFGLGDDSILSFAEKVRRA
jgi:hypothetical protein